MVKAYKLAKTKEKIARDNNLTPAQSIHYTGNDLFYDFSLFDQIDMPGDEKEAAKRDLMEHHSLTWFNQPLPTLAMIDRFNHVVGQIKTAPHRVYKNDGSRLMVIIEITGINLQKQERHTIWDEFKTARTYEAHTWNTENDIEL